MKRPPKYRLNYLFQKLRQEVEAKRKAIRAEAQKEKEKLTDMYPKIEFSPEELLELFHDAPLPSKRRFKAVNKKTRMRFRTEMAHAYLMHLTGAQAVIDRQEKLFNKAYAKIDKQILRRRDALDKAFNEIEEHFMLDGEYDLIRALEDFRDKKF